MKIGFRGDKRYIFIYVLFAVVFLSLSSIAIFFLTYYSDVSHFHEAVSAYMDPAYEDKGELTVDYGGKRYYPDIYSTAYITEDAIRGGITTRIRQYFVDEEEYDDCEKLIINYGEDAKMTFFALEPEGTKDVVLLKYERAGKKTTYYKIDGLKMIENILENIKLINK